MDLLIIFIASLLMVPLALFTAGPVRIISGIFFVLIFPGYTFLAALFPRKTSLDSLMRLALTLGLSLALVIILLLVLNFTPWGIRLDSSLISLGVFTGVMDGLAWLQRRLLSREERFFSGVNLNFKQYLGTFQRQNTADKVLNILLAVAVVAVLGTVAYVLVRNKNGEKFTQFYVLGLDGKADNYPHDIVHGQSGTVLLDIINEENAVATYKIEILIDGQQVNEIDSIVLSQGEKWEQPVTFTHSQTGDNREVQFELFVNDSPSFQELHLWIDVI